MLLPSALCDGGSSNRVNNYSTSSPSITLSPAAHQPRRSTTSLRIPFSQHQPTLAPPSLSFSAVFSSPTTNERSSTAEGHIASLFNSVGPGVSTAARAAGIFTTCKKLHQILSLDASSRIANSSPGGGIASSPAPRPTAAVTDRDVTMAMASSPLAVAPFTPKRRKTAIVQPSTPTVNATSSGARTTRATSVAMTQTTGSSSSLKPPAATQCPSTPKRVATVVRIPKTPMRRNKRRRVIVPGGGPGDENSDDDDGFYKIPVVVAPATGITYSRDPKTPAKRTRLDNPIQFDRAMIGDMGGSTGYSRPSRRRAMTTSSNNIARPAAASRTYNQRCRASAAAHPYGGHGHGRVRSMADASSMMYSSAAAMGRRRGSLLPPDELVNLDFPVLTAFSSPHTQALSSLSLNTPIANAASLIPPIPLSLNPPLAPPHEEDEALEEVDMDAMDISITDTPTKNMTSDNTTTTLRTRTRSASSASRAWSHQEDRHLVELVLQKLRLTSKEWADCAKTLGRDSRSVGTRWEQLVGSISGAGSARSTPTKRIGHRRTATVGGTKRIENTPIKKQME